MRALSKRVPVLGNEGVRLGLVRVAGAGFGGMVVLLTWQALKGEPLIYPDSSTVAALTALVAVIVVAASAVIVSGTRRVRTRPGLNLLT
jgi:hypothetical protein